MTICQVTDSVIKELEAERQRCTDAVTDAATVRDGSKVEIETLNAAHRAETAELRRENGRLRLAAADLRAGISRLTDQASGIRQRVQDEELCVVARLRAASEQIKVMREELDLDRAKLAEEKKKFDVECTEHRSWHDEAEGRLMQERAEFVQLREGVMAELNSALRDLRYVRAERGDTGDEALAAERRAFEQEVGEVI